MIKVLEHRSPDKMRRAEVWHDDVNGGVYRVIYFENSTIVHTTEVSGILNQAESLAEDFCLGTSNPELLFG